MKADMILVIDLGGGDARMIARKLRAEAVYCEVLPAAAGAAGVMEKSPAGLIVVGGTGEPVPACDPGLWALGVPALGIGGGARAMAHAMGGAVGGEVILDRLETVGPGNHPLFSGVEENVRRIERADALTLPPRFAELSSLDGVPLAFACDESSLYGIQFVPEGNDPDGNRILRNFALDICGLSPSWSMGSFLKQSVESIKSAVGGGTALMLLSGGADTSVCAALMHRAIGSQLRCIFVDTGLMRKGEGLELESAMHALGIPVTAVRAADRFIGALKGAETAARKSAAVYSELTRVLTEQASEIGRIDYLARGTIYTDILGAPDRLELDPQRALSDTANAPAVIEPLDRLFKSEVRELGRLLDLPDAIISRQPFPSEGLSTRCLGEATKDKLDIVRDADDILRAEIKSAGVERQASQCFCVLLGKCGLTGYVLALRVVHSAGAGAYAARLPYDMLERVTDRILAEAPGVARVVYDLTPAPPATVEW